MPQKNKSKSLVVVSDIHVGSKYAVCSEHPLIEVKEDSDPDKNSYTEWSPNPNQKKLTEGWNYCTDHLSQRANALVVNGEPIDGANYKELGATVWSPEINDQLNDVEILLKRIPFDNLYFVRGSGYHTQKEATNYEKTLAKQMNANKYKSVMGTYTHADFEANFEVFGKYINITHHVSFSNWWLYRTTPIAIQLAKMHFNHAANGFHTDVLIRSHAHYYVEVRFPHTVGLSTPAWKFPDGFMYRKGEPDMPNVGMVEIIIEPNGKIIIDPILCELDFRKSVIHL